MSKQIDRVNSAYNEFTKKIANYEKALKKNDLEAVAKAEEELKEAEGQYREEKQVLVFSELREADAPIKAAIERLEFETVGHKVERDKETKRIVGIAEVSKTVQIDLVKFCKFCDLPTQWQYKVQMLNKLLCLRAAAELKLTKAQIKEIDDSFAMDKLAKEVELGGTPTSNTQIVKQLQTVVDAIYFEDNGKGVNKFKVNNHDVAYLLMCYTRRGKQSLKVQTAKHTVMHSLVVDVMHRVITGKTYDIDYKMKKKDEPKTETEQKKASSKKSEKVSDTDTVKVKKGE